MENEFCKCGKAANGFPGYGKTVAKKKQLVIIGASGHGKVVSDVAVHNGYDSIRFLDDNQELTACNGFPVVGRCDDFSKFHQDFFVAIGEPEIRQRILEQLESAGKRIVTLIHPNAVIGGDVRIGIGSVVMAGAVINPGVRTGKGCIVNTCASIDHDSVLADFSHLSVGSHLAGDCVIGARTWIGAGATIINNIHICGGCMIGAGAVVIRNIEKPGTYVGCPARMIR